MQVWRHGCAPIAVELCLNASTVVKKLYLKLSTDHGLLVSEGAGGKQTCANAHKLSFFTQLTPVTASLATYTMLF